MFVIIFIIYIELKAHMKVISMFSGAGGLDLGFQQSGFEIIWANEYDKAIWETYKKNHNTFLDTRSIIDIPSSDIPSCDGIIGGPPCQSWSLAGSHGGIKDSRGKLFYEFIRVLKSKLPKFFIAENVPGIVSKKHISDFEKIINEFVLSGYRVYYQVLNASDFEVPQDRKRVFIVGFREDLSINNFEFPATISIKKNLHDVISDIKGKEIPALGKNKSNNGSCIISNHEYMVGGFSAIYMSRNRVKSWGEQSFTIQASGRHAPLHPDAPKMPKIGKDLHEFVKDELTKYRRLTVRECADIQTFPRNFHFIYNNINDGYKMVGNAVPVQLAYHVATSIRQALN
ncbi:DNA cytosine methyltransferase [Cysteiniphilum marinum]|uniref:DNA cytosine methyltransferase n=1 Tax=Cysteiniphilum marinum TaxID=2774191 RepID=UPI001F248821|nr:DNA cytosine methyltransferase [Cysteiniphilum marinum]